MKTIDVKEMTLYNVIYKDHTQVHVVASSYGKAAACAHLTHDEEIICISKISTTNVIL